MSGLLRWETRGGPLSQDREEVGGFKNLKRTYDGGNSNDDCSSVWSVKSNPHQLILLG